MGPSTVVQEYCLKWNNHHSTLVSVLDVLLKQESLVDVTLAAEGKSVKVHRLVLCACSTYFKELLCNQWDKQTVVFLKDVKFNQLKALVDYMYRGEVNVSQDQLAAFLSTAEALKIKGLADGDKESSKKQNKRPAQQHLSTSLPVASPPASASSRPVKRARKPSKDSETPQATAPLPSLVRIPPPVATEVSEAPSNSIDSPNDQPDDNDANAESEAGRSESPDVPLGGLEPKIETEEPDETMGSGDEENWSENEHSASQGDHHWGEGVNASVGSDFYGTNQSATENEDSNTGIGALALVRLEGEEEEAPPRDGYRCPRCGRSYSRRDNRNRHLRFECGQTPRFQCPVCELNFTRKNNVLRHLQRKHADALFTADLKASPIEIP